LPCWISPHWLLARTVQRRSNSKTKASQPGREPQEKVPDSLRLRRSGGPHVLCFRITIESDAWTRRYWFPKYCAPSSVAFAAPRVLGFRIPVYIEVLDGVGTQLTVAAAGALVCASLATHSSLWSRTILIARWIFGLCSVDFGLEHLTLSRLHPHRRMQCTQ
jgi:hypothetical protein